MSDVAIPNGIATLLSVARDDILSKAWSIRRVSCYRLTRFLTKISSRGILVLICQNYPKDNYIF